MKTQWREVLVAAGAEFDDCEHAAHFGNPERERRAALSGEVFADLSHFGLIEVRGEDAADFLQGQFSSDVRLVDAGHSQLSAYLNPKGRMLASFRIFQRHDAYYLRLPESMLEATLRRLKMFVLRARVELEDASAALVRIGLSGPRSGQELGEVLGQIPDAVDAVLTRGEVTAIRIPGPHPRFELHAGLDEARRIWERLNVRCAPVGAPAWALLDILAGIPDILPQTSEAHVPLMANLDRLGGVSFQKGCYPGQEIVARTKYLGKLKKRMYLGRIAVETSPAPGSALFDVEDPRQPCGQILDARPHPDGGQAALAVMQSAAALPGRVQLGEPGGPAFELLPLPYSLVDPD